VDEDFEPVYPDIDGAAVSKKKLDSLFNKAVEVCAKAQEVPMDERTAFHVERARRAKGIFKEIIDLCLKRTHALDREILHAGEDQEEEEERPVGEAKQEKVKVMLMEGKVLANLGTMYGTEGRVKVAHHKFVRAIDIFNQLGNATFEKLALERAVSNCVSPLYRNYREGIRMAKRQQKLAKKMKNRADEELLEEHIGTFKEALRRENSDKRVVRLMEGGREMYVLSQRDEGEGKLAQQASHFHPGLTRARATAAGGGESKGAGGPRGGRGGNEFGGGDAPNKVSRLVEFEGPMTMQVSSGG
jgi:flagellin-specific chaperone FliS